MALIATHVEQHSLLLILICNKTSLLVGCEIPYWLLDSSALYTFMNNKTFEICQKLLSWDVLWHKICRYDVLVDIHVYKAWLNCYPRFGALCCYLPPLYKIEDGSSIDPQSLKRKKSWLRNRVSALLRSSNLTSSNISLVFRCRANFHQRPDKTLVWFRLVWRLLWTKKLKHLKDLYWISDIIGLLTILSLLKLKTNNSTRICWPYVWIKMLAC